MPGSLAHLLFATDCLARDAAFLPFGEEDHDFVRVGTQGPDPCFFYGVLPWRIRQNRAKVFAFGSFLHDLSPDAIFLPLLVKALELPDEVRLPVFAHIYGMLLHYLLDRTVHPYVFARSGFDRLGKLTGRFTADHARFEAAMDVALWSRLRPGIARALPHESLKAPEAGIAEVSLFISDTFDSLGAGGQGLGPRDFFKAWDDMKATLAFLSDSKGTKARFLRRIGMGQSIVAAVIHPVQVPEGMDYLNEGHCLWRNPCTGEAYDRSVTQLYDLAFDDSRALAGLVSQAFQGTIDRGTWMDFLGTRNHDGRRPGETMRYFESIYGPVSSGNKTVLNP